jgi:uncharacterized protein (DUF1810 family)
LIIGGGEYHPDMDRDLDRFVNAQRGDYEGAIKELRVGEKTGHWIWYVFPQLRGLGRSRTSWDYGIVSLHEARAYLAHPVLGPRIRECMALLLEIRDRTAEQILHGDAVKVRSSATLFHRAAPDEPVFRAVLDRFYGGLPDPRTDELLGRTAGDSD